LNEIIYGVLPFVVIMILSVVLLCFVPGIATGLSDLVMGPMQAH
jgi:C4-dicarboxylate transporter DctM subunit